MLFHKIASYMFSFATLEQRRKIFDSFHVLLETVRLYADISFPGREKKKALACTPSILEFRRIFLSYYYYCCVESVRGAPVILFCLLGALHWLVGWLGLVVLRGGEKQQGSGCGG